jgi:oxygen-independent coproporphyrinogen-3 oxidase
LSGARHLYVHLPFCAHRCGYCDFVTVVGRTGTHGAYVDALLCELELERPLLDGDVDTVFIGGGTPTFTDADALERLLAALPAAAEVTVEANPETITREIAELLSRNGVNRVSLGAQTFNTALLDVLERRAQPAAVRDAFSVLRDAGFDNVNVDLVYGIPGQSAADLEHDLAEVLTLGPEHVSCYELEAKRGTRFAFAHGDELTRQADAMETYFEQVVATLTAAGYRWYETSNFSRMGTRDLRSRHNLAYWEARDYVGLGIGAVSTVAGLRWKNRPSLSAYVDALACGSTPPRDVEPLDGATRHAERVMLGLRLDEPLDVDGLGDALDADALERLTTLGLVVRDGELLRLTERGRFLGGAVTAELLA